jgi:crossover junction endodeoxyribonuclease RuvC
MAFLGVDSSLRATGLCKLSTAGDVDHLETVHTKGLKGAARLAYVEQRVLRLLDHVTFVIIEGYSYNSISKHHALGEVGGAIKLALYKHNVAYLEVSPAALKKFALGNAQASKEAMVEAAQRGGVDAQDDNQADAFFLASIARCLGTGDWPRVRARLEVLRRLQAPERIRKPRVRRLIKNAL